MECKRNNWDCEKGRGDGCFKKAKVRVACLDIDETEREWRGIIALGKWYHCLPSRDGEDGGGMDKEERCSGWS